jgi:predicted Zn-dependent protease
LPLALLFFLGAWTGHEIAAHPELGRQLARARADQDWWRVAQLHRYRGEWAEAEAAYARARTRQGALPTLDLDLGQMLVEAGAPEKALAPLARYIAARPDDPEGWSARARALSALGKPAEAARDYEAAIARSRPTRVSLVDDTLRWARAAVAAGTPVPDVLAGLDAGAARLGGAISLQVAALDLAEERGRVVETLTRVQRLEATAQRKEAWAARRARLLAATGRWDESRAAWGDVLHAIAALPASRQDTPAMRALRAEAMRETAR